MLQKRTPERENIESLQLNRESEELLYHLYISLVVYNKKESLPDFILIFLSALVPPRFRHDLATILLRFCRHDKPQSTCI